MAKLEEIVNFYNMLLKYKDANRDLEIDYDDSSSKNYTSYNISFRGSGNAKYEDCIIVNHGDPDDEYPENVCTPEDMDTDELLSDFFVILVKIEKVFGSQIILPEDRSKWVV